MNSALSSQLAGGAQSEMIDHGHGKRGPIDRRELARLASAMSRSYSHMHDNILDELEKQESLTTAKTGSPSIDPTSPNFDVYQ